MSAGTLLKANRFTRLGVWYILALSTIATVIIAGQVFIQLHLKDQENDSHVVNIAGKQRMLSQKLVKDILLLQSQAKNQSEALCELESSLQLWETSQRGLVDGNDSLNLSGKNSNEILSLFESVDKSFLLIDSNAREILNEYKKSGRGPDLMESKVSAILESEESFLTGMDAIVYQYDLEAKSKVTRLSRLEYTLLIISIVIILVEIIFIFRPTTINVSETISKLLLSEKHSKKMSEEIRELYISLEKSYEQIAHINQPIDNPRIFAKSDQGGNVTFIAQPFSQLIGKEKTDSQQFCDLFDEMKNPNDWMDSVVDTVSEEKIWKGEIKFRNANQEETWVLVTVTPILNEQGEIDELVMMGSDITKRKRAEQKIHNKNQAEIDKRINQQKFRSVLILEGQEEERKRIAMDIHDGIGQMLTSLKYQVESIDIGKKETMSQKLKEIDSLIKLVIKEVRRITFNLRPMVLGDYGLQAALSLFVNEISKLIDIQLEFHCETEVVRLPQKVENNIFRIIQEAINNAIKYSKATKIDVYLSQQESELLVEVKDDGEGFDVKLVDERSVNYESGRGLFNMYERSEYINGSLEINSAKGKGTSVRLKVLTRVQVDSNV
jgi:PAS domain S-box-containing protein